MMQKEKEKAKKLKEDNENQVKAKEKAEQNKTKAEARKKRQLDLEKSLGENVELSPKRKTGAKTDKTLPENVIKIIGNNHELERAPGNGACAIGCFTKHAFDDVTLGPEEGRILNSEIADNFWHYKKLIEFPYERPVGGADTVKFEEHEEDKLLDFLRNHPRNGYVWRGYMDLQALSNKYGMPIQIISINDFSDPNPKSERIEPDADFVVEKVINEMILLNTGQCHFDLIKKKQPEKRTQNSTKDLKINEPQKVLNDVLEKEASVDLNKGVSKSDKVEISELKVLVEGMRKEIINLKQNKCQCVKVTDTGKSLNNGSKTCGPKPNESIESGHETTKNV